MATSFSPRLSLQSQLSALPQAHSLLQDFDMCRIFSSNLDLQDAMNYAALEHIIRVGTSEEDIQAYYDLLPGDLAVALMMLFRRKEEVGPIAMKELEELLTDEKLRAVGSLPVYLILYELREEGELERTVVEPEEAGHWPIVCCLMAAELLCLLYPSGATFLDGYDAYTCELRDVLVPPSVLQSIRPSLSMHYQPTSMSMQTQTKRARTPVKESEAMGLGIDKDMPSRPVSDVSKSGSFTEALPAVPEVVKPVIEPVKPVIEPVKPVIEPVRPVVQPAKTVVYEWKAPARKGNSSVMGIQSIDQAHINPSTRPLPMTITRKITVHKSKSTRNHRITETLDRMHKERFTETSDEPQKGNGWDMTPAPPVTRKPQATQQSTRDLCGTSDCCLS